MQECPIHQVTTPSSQELADISSIRADLLRVRDFMKSLVEAEHADTTRDALFSAALIAYRRCFGSGVRKPLKRSDVLTVGRNAHELHDHLINLANKLVAHSVNSFEDAKVGIVIHNDSIIGSAVVNARLVLFAEDGCKQVHDLAGALIREVLDARFKELQDLVTSEAKQMPLDDVKAGKLLQYTAPGPEAGGKRR